MSVFKCPNCHDDGLPADELPCWKCGSSKPATATGDDTAAPSSERIAKLSAALDLDIAKLGSGASNGFAVGDEVMLPGELRAILEYVQRVPLTVTIARSSLPIVERLAVAEGLLARAMPAVSNWHDAYWNRTATPPDTTMSVVKLLLDYRAFAPAPATPATADEVSK